MKKALTALMALILLILAGCSGSSNQQTPEDYISSIYKGLISSKITYYSFYTNYFSSESKKCISKDEFMEAQKEELGDKVLTGIKDVSSELLTDNIYKVNANVIYLSENKNEITENITDYVIKEDGAYKYLYKGITSKKIFIMPENSETSPLHMTAVNVYNSIDGIFTEIEIKNSSSTSYILGKNSPSTVTLTASDVSYTSQIPEIVKIGTDESVRIMVEFSGAQGDAGIIKLQNIFSSDFNGNLIDTGDGGSYTVMLQEFPQDVNSDNSQNND